MAKTAEAAGASAVLAEEIRRLDGDFAAQGDVMPAPALEELLDSFSEQVRRTLGAAFCRIFIVDRARGELWRPLAAGRGDIRFSASSSGLKGVLETGRSLSLGEVAEDPALVRCLGGPGGCGPALAVPFKNSQGAVAGVFVALKGRRQPPFDRNDEAMLQILAAALGADIENARLRHELSRSRVETIFQLARMAEFRDVEDTPAHLKNIRTYSRIIAGGFGFPSRRAEVIAVASPLHDVGKISITDAVLKKRGPLTPEEYDQMKQHAFVGWNILSGASSPLLRLAADIALTHHERFDGSGYPRGLKKDEIPVETQVVALADVFDALTVRRHYKRAWAFDEAVAYIRENSGKLFDPAGVASFLRAAPGLREALS